MILEIEDFVNGNVDTGFIPSHQAELSEPPPPREVAVCCNYPVHAMEACVCLAIGPSCRCFQPAPVSTLVNYSGSGQLWPLKRRPTLPMPRYMQRLPFKCPSACDSGSSLRQVQPNDGICCPMQGSNIVEKAAKRAHKRSKKVLALAG